MAIKSLDQAIKHFEEVAEENRKEQNYWLMSRDKENMFSDVDFEDLAQNACDIAEENEQLAEWLRELQKWRALRDSINKLCDVDCEYPEYRESGTMCDACPIGAVKEYFEQIFDGEVNANDRN